MPGTEGGESTVGRDADEAGEVFVAELARAATTRDEVCREAAEAEAALAELGASVADARRRVLRDVAEAEAGLDAIDEGLTAMSLNAEGLGTGGAAVAAHMRSLSVELRRLNRLRDFLITVQDLFRMSDDARAALASDGDTGGRRGGVASPRSKTRASDSAPGTAALDAFRVLVEAFTTALPQLRSTSAEEVLRARISVLARELRKVLSRLLADALPPLLWPRVKRSALSDDDAVLERFRDAFRQLVVAQLSSTDHSYAAQTISSGGSGGPIGRNATTGALWAVQVMARPLVLRFRHHFMEKRATNRNDKPEWFFAFALEVLRDHLPFVGSECQAVVADLPFGVLDISAQFTHCMVTVVARKISSLLRTRGVRRDDARFCHVVDETLLFQKTLHDEFGYGAVPPLADEPAYAQCLDVLTEDEEALRRWLDVDKRFALKRLSEAVSDADAWICPYDELLAAVDAGRRRSSREAKTDVEVGGAAVVVRGRRADGDDSDEDSASDSEDSRAGALRPSNCAEALVAILHAITDRYRLIQSKDTQLAFLDTVQRPLLAEFVYALDDVASDCSLERDPDTALRLGSWKLYASLINTAHYLATVLGDWGDDGFFLELYEHRVAQLRREARQSSGAPHATPRVGVRGTVKSLVRGGVTAARSEMKAAATDVVAATRAITADDSFIGPGLALKALGGAVASVWREVGLGHAASPGVSSPSNGGGSAESKGVEDDADDEARDMVGPLASRSMAGSPRAHDDHSRRESLLAHIMQQEQTKVPLAEETKHLGIGERAEQRTPGLVTDSSWLQTDGGLFAHELGVLRRLSEDMTAYAAARTTEKFVAWARPYAGKRMIASSAVAAADAAVRDLSPELCEAASVLRRHIVTMRAQLVDHHFEAYCRRLAADVAEFLQRTVAYGNPFSLAGAQQLATDVSILTDLFHLSDTTLDGAFASLRDTVHVLSLPTSRVESLNHVLSDLLHDAAAHAGLDGDGSRDPGWREARDIVRASGVHKLSPRRVLALLSQRIELNGAGEDPSWWI